MKEINGQGDPETPTKTLNMSLTWEPPTCYVVSNKYVQITYLQLRIQMIAITIIKHYVYTEILKVIYIIYRYAQYADIHTSVCI